MVKKVSFIIHKLTPSLIYSNIWVAASLAASSGIVSFYSGDNNIRIIAFNFCLAIIGYNYIYWSIYFICPNKILPQRKEWMDKNKGLVVLTTCLATYFTIVIFFEFETSIQLRILLFFVISFLYILPSKKNIGLRWIPSLKVFIISFTWTLLSTVSLNNNEITYWIYTAVFLFVMSITIPFDIRDIDSDQKSLKTIPQLIGIKNSIRLTQCSLLISTFILSIISQSISIQISNFVFLIIALIITNNILTNRSQNYIGFTVEGIPMLWLAILLIGRCF